MEWKERHIVTLCGDDGGDGGDDDDDGGDGGVGAKCTVRIELLVQ